MLLEGMLCPGKGRADWLTIACPRLSLINLCETHTLYPASCSSYTQQDVNAVHTCEPKARTGRSASAGSHDWTRDAEPQFSLRWPQATRPGTLAGRIARAPAHGPGGQEPTAFVTGAASSP